MSISARVWGCRGSLAAPGEHTAKYGGNTSCVSIDAGDGTLIVLDSGTGMRALGATLQRGDWHAMHILLTHLHMDHLEGIGFFGPLFWPGLEVHIWGPPSPTKSLQTRVSRYMSPPLFPVYVSEVPSRPIFHDSPDGEWMIGAARVSSQPVSHRGPTVGYRVELGGSSLCYIPDHDPALGRDLTTVDPAWISGYGVARDADVLLHDSQYTQAEYEERLGWGHSSIQSVVDFATMTNAKRLVMFHHDPMHSDDELEQKLELAQGLCGSRGKIELAREGMTIEV